jgi:hypothetical protein
MKAYLLFFCSSLLCFTLSSQNKLTVNGQPITFDCAKITSVDEMDTLVMPRVKIYHAEINNNCLELGVFAGDCVANIELVTDNQLIQTTNLTLHFLLRYDKDMTPCKATLKTKLYFDILPFKNLRSGKIIAISFLGESFNLMYK